MSPKPLIIIGAGGHGKVVADLARNDHRYNIIGFIDDNPENMGRIIVGIPILGNRKVLTSYKNVWLTLAIGDNNIRRSIGDKLTEQGFHLANLVHPTAFISPYAHLDEGIVVMPQSTVNAEAQVGKYAILNTGCIVEHDCFVGIATHISIGSRLAGGVTVGNETLIGAGATILPKVKIGDGVTVGAGAVVIEDLSDNVVAVGVPARIVSRRAIYPNQE